MRLESGIPSRGSVFVRFFAEGPEGAEIAIDFAAEKAQDVRGSVKLTPTEASAPATNTTATSAEPTKR